VEEVRKLKEAGENLLVYGSGQLVKSLMQHNLIDRYRLMLYPLVLASGQRFFREGGQPATLSLADAKTTSTGVVVLTYQLGGTVS
jgi:dihydrofolate reductase